MALLALIPLLVALDGAGGLRGALIGAVFGFAFFGLSLYWIALFGELAWGGLVTMLSCFGACFGLLSAALIRRPHPVRTVLGLASSWVALEFLRTAFPLGGFGWGSLSYTQVDDRALLPLASVTGSWGISFVVVCVNVLLWLALREPRWGRRGAFLAVAGGLILAPLILPAPSVTGPRVDVAAIQIAVAKDVAVTPELRSREVADRFFEMDRRLADDPPDLVVWPEDSMDTDPSRDPALGAELTATLGEVGAPTLVGGINGPADGRRYNQGVLYAPDGTRLGVHTKTHLVPFGEYVPWRRQLSFLELLQQVPTDLTPGRVLEPLTLDGVELANVICFENAFPEVARRLVARGAGFVVTSTNNASYLTTAAARQHLDISRMRAVENGRWVVHAAISGSSAFIDPEGKVYDRTDLFRPGIIRRDIQASSARTPYNRFGDWFAWGSVLLAGALILTPKRRTAPNRPLATLPQRPRTLVILPTYNERPTIGQVLDSLLALDAAPDILVVDDGSPDATGDYVAERASSEPRVRLLRRPRKAGLASAYLAGFELAVGDGYDLAVEMDSDLSHDPDELPRLLEAARDHHLVIGSRYVPGGSVTNWGFLRRMLSRAGNSYARLCLGFPLKDSTSGFRVYRTDLVRDDILHRGIHSEGYGFQIELAYRTWADGWSVGEAPISFREREHGHSKISRRIVVEALWEVTVWGARDRFGRPRP